MAESKKPDIWMPLYIGNYLADTANLNATRSGAYLHLLMYYWRNGPLEDDPGELLFISKLDGPDALSMLQALLKKFFTHEADGLWHQAQQDKEREKWHAKKIKAIEKATLAADVRWKNDPG
jgi:uncharacterized protein YdaU (DUF1376 family)